MVDVFKSKNMAWWNDDDMEKRLVQIIPPPHITLLPHFPPTQTLLHRTAPPTTQASNQDRPAPPERVEHPT